MMRRREAQIFADFDGAARDGRWEGPEVLYFLGPSSRQSLGSPRGTDCPRRAVRGNASTILRIPRLKLYRR